jgi:hypothetical protein
MLPATGATYLLLLSLFLVIRKGSGLPPLVDKP